MLDNYFSSVFNTTTDDGNITPNDINISDESSTASVITSHHTVNNYGITTEDVLKTLIYVTTNKSPGPDNIYPKVLKETKSKETGALTSLFNISL